VPPNVFALGGAGASSGESLRFARFARAPKSRELGFVEFHEEPVAGEIFARHGSGLRDLAGLRAALERLRERMAVPPEAASLVLPDHVVRHVFTEIGELPSEREAAEEMLRWKLKRLIPQRVEELRLAARRVAPLRGQEEPERLLVTFAPEALLAGFEELFAEQRIHLGSIASETLLTVAALAPALADGELTALLVVEANGYTLTVLRAGEIFLVRPKVHPQGDVADQAAAAERELRLTRSFLGEQLAQVAVGRVLLVAPEPAEPAWMLVAREALGGNVMVARREHLGLGREGPPVGWRELLPLVGAAATEVR
jgi:hypothetical protein